MTTATYMPDKTIRTSPITTILSKETVQMKTQLSRFTMALGIALAMMLTGTSAYGANVTLIGVNPDINLTTSWSASTDGDRRAFFDSACYLDTTYTNEDPNKPHIAAFWSLRPNGQLDLRNGASLSYGNDLKLAGNSSVVDATITMNPGSFFETTLEIDHSGLVLGVEGTKHGTFIVNNGGTVGAKTDVAVGRPGLLGDTADCVGVFKVIGDGGTISSDQFKVSRFSRVEFELDDTGISPINVGDKLTIWKNATTGLAAGNLIVDTSAMPGAHTVTLFNYVDLATGSDNHYGTIPAGNDRFGTVTVTGPDPSLSPLVAGNGTDAGTYLLDYGTGTNDSVTLTYTNEPAGGTVIRIK